ncbi:tail fiber protein [Paenibacillus chibensis]|uniref:Tail fiber protein n=1 Tax=Paenibacillus chibensis TaxID=59846 RepID=A0ABU6PSS5_9BACL|nr:tail fiber protein [Paenibacillus chibensis]
MPTNTPNLKLYKVDGETDGSDTFNVDVVLNDNWDKIDAAIKSVEDAVGDISIPYASLTKKGIVQLSSATDGTRETVAATEKAVKAAYDRAVTAESNSKSYADTQIAFSKAQIEQESKQNIRGMERELANLNLQLEASKRVPSGVTFGSNFADSFGMEIDTTKLIAKTALTVGQTDMPVDSIGTLKTGMEVTVYDDTNIERTTVTETKMVENVTDNVVTDATVVNEPYDTSGNGGRKLIRLSNGWIVAGAYDSTNSTVKLYVSKDNGSSWLFLTQTIGSSQADKGFALVSSGTRVYLVSIGSGYVSVQYYSFDALNVGSTTNVILPVDTTQTPGAFSGISLAINDAGTELHAAWASKNSTYPNSFNIRYAKGIINADGSVTWGAFTQVSNENITGRNFQNPSILIKGDGNPAIICEYGQTGVMRIVSITSNGSVWSGLNPLQIVYEGGAYTQSSPSAIFVPKSINGLTNGRIWVAWEGYDSAVTNRSRIKVSYSDDGGVTWSIPSIIEISGYQSYQPSITANKNNELFIIFESNNLYKVKCTNGTWGSPVSINGLNLRASTLFDQIFSINFTEPLFIYRGSSTNKKVGFYGTWKTVVSVPTLKLAPLKKAYKEKAFIARTSAVIDTVNKCAKFGGWSTQVTNTVTDATVVNTAYNTSGSGRKMALLDNGWIASVVFDTSTSVGANVYISKDNGKTWLFSFNNTMGSSTIADVAIVAQGTFVYLLTTFSTYSQISITIGDVSRSSGGVLSTNWIDTSQSSFGRCSLAINDARTELHAAWESKNSTYPKSFNIRYAKGVINADGSVTWGAAEQVTTFNDVVINARTPSIVLDGKSTPVVLHIYDAGSAGNFSLCCATKSSGWGSRQFYTSTRSQANPSAIFVPPSISGKPNGRIWVTWQGQDDVDNTIENIRVMYSDDRGLSWSQMQKLTVGNTNATGYPSITANKNGEIGILFHGYAAGGYRIRILKYVNGAWIGPSDVTPQRSGNMMYPSTIAETLDYLEPLYIYMDSAKNQVSFSGTWIGIGEAPILENDIRFKVKDTDEAVTWVQCDAALTLTAALNGQAMDKTTAAAGNEDQFVKALTASGPAEIRLTMKRSSTSNDVKVNKILGGVG